MKSHQPKITPAPPNDNGWDLLCMLRLHVGLHHSNWPRFAETTGLTINQVLHLSRLVLYNGLICTSC